MDRKFSTVFSPVAYWNSLIKGDFNLEIQDVMNEILLHLTAAATAQSLQSCPTLCDPLDGSPPGSPVPGILQARILRPPKTEKALSPTLSPVLALRVQTKEKPRYFCKYLFSETEALLQQWLPNNARGTWPSQPQAESSSLERPPAIT